jgi:hypothetical protein
VSNTGNLRNQIIDHSTNMRANRILFLLLELPRLEIGMKA